MWKNNRSFAGLEGTWHGKVLISVLQVLCVTCILPFTHTYIRGHHSKVDSTDGTPVLLPRGDSFVHWPSRTHLCGLSHGYAGSSGSFLLAQDWVPRDDFQGSSKLFKDRIMVPLVKWFFQMLLKYVHFCSFHGQETTTTKALACSKFLSSSFTYRLLGPAKSSPFNDNYLEAVWHRGLSGKATSVSN